MKFGVLSVLGLVLAVAAGAFAQTSTAIAYQYATLNFPGATSTTTQWINNGNVIVGYYSLGTAASHGFVWQNGTFKTIDFPGAMSTFANGINDGGDIVGTYILSGFQSHGFRLHNGAFTTIDFPGAVGASGLVGINNSGTMVGNYGNSQGFILTNGTFKTLDAPQLNQGEPVDTELFGISNLGWITGRVFTGDFWRGFWYINGEFDFLAPAFSLDNNVSGSNGHGDVVGQGPSGCFIAFSVETSEGSESTERFPMLEMLNTPSNVCPAALNYARVITGGNYIGTPALTLHVSSPVNHGTYTNPVHFSASATGVNSVSQIQVWVNSKEIYHISGGSLSANLTLPLGNNDRVVVQAVDSKGTVAKVVEAVTVK